VERCGALDESSEPAEGDGESAATAAAGALRPKQDGLDVGRPARARTTAPRDILLFLSSPARPQQRQSHRPPRLTTRLLFVARNRAHPLQHCSDDDDDDDEDDEDGDDKQRDNEDVL